MQNGACCENRELLIAEHLFSVHKAPRSVPAHRLTNQKAELLKISTWQASFTIPLALPDGNQNKATRLTQVAAVGPVLASDSPFGK